MDKLLGSINEVINLIFELKFSRAMECLIGVIDQILKEGIFIGSEKNEYIMVVLKDINVGISDGDFLRISDLLEYELMPLLRQIWQEEQ